MERYEVEAFNTAVASENKIHDDDIARKYGFAGGLVPGVDVYAYLTHPVAEAWGLDWLSGGTAEVRFATPVYDGNATSIVPDPIAADRVDVTAVDGDGTECAAATFTLPAEGPAVPPSTDDWAVAPLPTDRPDATPEAMAAYADPSRGDQAGALPTYRETLTTADTEAYLEAERDELEIYRAPSADGAPPPVHPSWMLRRANDALMVAVTLGPWIHVGSTVTHHGLLRVDDDVEVRSRLVRWWEAKGHEFVEIDVALVVDGEVRTRIDHTAIYRPRPRT